MKVKFDIVKPNLYVVGDKVCFGADPSDIISISRSIDEVVKKYVGDLKVKKSDVEVIKSGKSNKTERKYSVPLKIYLDALEEKTKYSGDFIGITDKSSQLFGLSHIIDAETIENGNDISQWRKLQKDLANPKKAFDEYDKKSLVYILDRKKTLKEMKELHQELDPRIPDNHAELVVVSGYVPSGEKTPTIKNLGVVSFVQLKAKDKTKIEKAKSQLVERLKDIEGPCLSLDTLDIYRQMTKLYTDAPELIQKYGDVLKSPWKTRLFKLP